MPSLTRKSFFGKYVFNIFEEVYEPAEDSYLFAENLCVREGQRVLDVGTGSGILGIIAAKQACDVLAIDLNPYSIRCAKQNAALNCVNNKITFVQCDLLTSLSESTRFDLILFNAPYVPSEESETNFWLGRSWSGGITGRHVIDRFISQVSPHLEKNGQVFLMQSTLSSVDETISKFSVYGLKAEIVASLHLAFFETLVLLKAQRSV